VTAAIAPVTPLRPEVDRGLDAARTLAALGVPVFVAPAWPDAPRDKTPFRLPPGWERTEPDAAAVDTWRPGDALCAVMGHVVDLLDFDPRSAGETDPLATLTAAGEVPDVLARADSPSGGEHLFVRSMGTRSRDDLLPGLDVKAGAPNGQGRGFAFLAPTEKASKITGEIVAYRWTQPPPASLDPFPPFTGPAVALSLRIRRALREVAADPTDPGTAGTSTPAAALYGSVGTGAGLAEHRGPIPEGRRHSALISYAGYLRRRGVGLDLAETLMMHRLADCAQPPLARYPVTPDEALSKLRDAYGRYAAGTPDLDPAVEVVLDGDGRPVNPLDVDVLDEDGIEALPEREPLIEGVLDRGTYAVLYAEPKAGKSFLALDWAESVARGIDWNGRACQSGNVLWIAAEGAGSMRIRQPAWRKARGHGKSGRFAMVRRSVPLDSPGEVAHLADLIRRREAHFVIIDTWADSLGDANEDNASETRAAHKLIREALLAATPDGRGVVLVLAHTRKTFNGKGLPELRGSGAFLGAVDAAFNLDPQGDGRVLIRQTHARDVDNIDPIAFRIVPAGASAVLEYESAGASLVSAALSSAGERAAGQKRDAVLAAIRQHQNVPDRPATTALIMRATSLSRSAVRRHLDTLETSMGLITRGGVGNDTTYRLADLD